MTLTGSAMYSVTRLLDVDEPDRRGCSAAAYCWLPPVPRTVVEPTLPDRATTGDVLVHPIRFGTKLFQSDLDDPAITLVNGADYTGMPIRTGEPGSVYRHCCCP